MSGALKLFILRKARNAKNAYTAESGYTARSQDRRWYQMSGIQKNTQLQAPTKLQLEPSFLVTNRLKRGPR
jgi:hypothetical protein